MFKSTSEYLEKWVSFDFRIKVVSLVTLETEGSPANSGVTRDEDIPTGPRHRKKNNLVITIIDTIIDTFFPK